MAVMMPTTISLMTVTIRSVNAESTLQITDGCHDHSVMIRVKYTRALVLVTILFYFIFRYVVRSTKVDLWFSK